MSGRAFLAMLVVVLATGLPGCTNLFFQPMRQHVHSPADAGVEFRDVTLTARDGTRLHAWVLPARGEARGVVVFLHGNAENISTHVASVLWLPARGYHVLAPDYRGYGRSEGRPTLRGVLEDVDAAVGHAADPVHFGGLPVVLFGQSLGGSLALVHAGEDGGRSRLAGVVTDSAFSSFRDIAREKLRLWWLTAWLAWPLGLLVEDGARPSAGASRIAPVPLLLMHGDRDGIVPPEHARRLFDAARAPKTLWIAPGAGHIAALRSEEWRDRLASYLDGIVRRP
jgi:fermentation-respiration switch protein FrsA (DUF1100 family)